MKKQRDKNGRRHGLWEDYYPGGKLWYKGIYKNGRQNGPWETYHYSGEVNWKGAFKREIQVGLWHHPGK